MFAVLKKKGERRNERLEEADSRSEGLSEAGNSFLRSHHVPVRKPKKLPAKVAAISYALEYGTDTLEIHEDAIKPGDRVIICDDLLATGGTAAATAKLIQKLGGKVEGTAFAVELTFLNGRAKLPGLDVFSLIQYDK